MAAHNRMPLEEAQRRVRILSKELIGFISRKFDDGMYEMAARQGNKWLLATPESWDTGHYGLSMPPTWYDMGFIHVQRTASEFSDEEMDIAEGILNGET